MIRNLSDRVVYPRDGRRGNLYARKKSNIRARIKSSEGDAPDPLPRRIDFIADQIPTRVTYRPRSDGGRIVADLWPLILCPDSGIVRPAAAAISHPFEKPRAERARIHSSSETWIAMRVVLIMPIVTARNHAFVSARARRKIYRSLTGPMK